MGKYIIIGVGGMGLAIARRLKEQGCSLHIIGREPEATAGAAQALGAGHAIADVTDHDALAKAVAAAGSPVDGLCYAVGTITLKPIARLTTEDFERDYLINAIGAAKSVQAALPALKDSGQATASVLLFSSIAVQQGFTAHASIAMAKGAVEGLVRSLAAELAPKIRVNAIAPSLTRTKIAQALTNNASLTQTIATLHPLQRIGEAEDVADLGALLLSEKSSWISGQVFGVDGGRSTLRTKG